MMDSHYRPVLHMHTQLRNVSKVFVKEVTHCCDYIPRRLLLHPIWAAEPASVFSEPQETEPLQLIMVQLFFYRQFSSFFQDVNISLPVP